VHSDNLILIVCGIKYQERSTTGPSSCTVSVVKYFLTYNLSLRLILTVSFSHTLLLVKSVNIFIWPFNFIWFIMIYFLLIVLKVLAWIRVSCNFYHFFPVLLKFIIKIALQSFFICSVVTLTKIQFKNNPIIRFFAGEIQFKKSFVIQKYSGLDSI
jgi:hypothetical protein